MGLGFDSICQSRVEVSSIILIPYWAAGAFV